MKKEFALVLALAGMAACAQEMPVVSVVPEPVSVEVTGKIHAYSGVDVKINPELKAEEYILNTEGKTALVEAGSEAGAFRASMTLEQITVDGKVPGVLIQDWPDLSYRGAHLDCVRHFWTIDQVKEFIDMMAVHKLNVLHWHLTDDQGWRFEVKKYPRLQEVAAWRSGTLIGHEGRNNHNYDTIRVGGYYTQDECREIVQYCADRYITVIPEIEMPGHALAALAAYPEFGCTGGPYEVSRNWGVFPDIFCVGKPATVQFLKDVLDEVCEVFPSEYIHIGGDEAPRDRWKKCRDCQKLMKANGLKTEAELQSWLVRTIEEYLAAKGRRIIGWDEILEGGVTPSATVMSWQGPAGGKAAAALGNDVIMAPNSYCYLDYYQTEANVKNGEPAGIGGYVSLRKVYSFDPYDELDAEASAHIKGAQVNLWTEYITTWDNIQYHELPRVAAIAEVGWTGPRRGTYEDFVERCRAALLPIYERNGWNYADFAFRNPPVE